MDEGGLWGIFGDFGAGRIVCESRMEGIEVSAGSGSRLVAAPMSDFMRMME